jgi:hypothetical protein
VNLKPTVEPPVLSSRKDSKPSQDVTVTGECGSLPSKTVLPLKMTLSNLGALGAPAGQEMVSW